MGLGVLALPMMLALAGPPASTDGAGVSAPDSPSPVGVLVDATDLDPDAAQYFTETVITRAATVLSDRGFRSVAPTEAPAHRMQVSIERPVQDDPTHYRISVQVFHDGREVGPDVEPAVCSPCTENLAIEQAVERLRQATALLEREPPPPPPPPPPVAGPQSTARSAIVSSDAPPTSYPITIGPVGIASAVVGLAGVATTIAGTVQVARDGQQRRADDGMSIEITRTRDQGIALVGVGTAAMVLGATGLAVDLTVLSKRRAEGRVSVAPAAGGSYGLAVRGTF